VREVNTSFYLRLHYLSAELFDLPLQQTIDAAHRRCGLNGDVLALTLEPESMLD
jgi:hypothetical protein